MITLYDQKKKKISDNMFSLRQTLKKCFTKKKNTKKMLKAMSYLFWLYSLKKKMNIGTIMYSLAHFHFHFQIIIVWLHFN